MSGPPPPAPAAGSPRPLVLLLAALALAAGVYANAVHGPFVWDDRMLIGDSSKIHSLDPRAHLGGSFWHDLPGQRGDATYYRPLVTLSYAVDWARGGGRPGPFHVTNLLLHLAVVALVFALARQAGAAPVAAAAGAAWFAVFPRLTECVTWISGRTDLMAAALALAGLLLHHRGRDRPWHRLGAGLLLLAGLLAKEVAAAAVLGVLAYELTRVLRRERPPRQAALAAAPALGAVAVYATLRRTALAGVPKVPFDDLVNPLLVPLQTLGRYLLMVADPRPRLQIGDLRVLEPALAGLGAAAALAIAWGLLRWRRRPPPPLHAALVVTALAAVGMVLHLVRFRVNVVAADRFVYLSLAGLAGWLAALASGLPPCWRAAALAAVLVATGASSALTVARNEDWNDEVRLWRVAVATTEPPNTLPANELGNALRRVARPAEAAEVLRAGLARATSDLERWGLEGNLAASLADQGLLEEARGRFAALVEREPGLPLHYFNLGVADLRLLRFDDGEQSLRKALALLPSYPAARAALALSAQVRRTAAELPPERDDEPAATRLERARLWTLLGVPSRAVPLWRRVLEDRAAGAQAVEEGAAYLVEVGDEASAELALRRAAEARLAPERQEMLAEAAADRFGAARR